VARRCYSAAPFFTASPPRRFGAAQSVSNAPSTLQPLAADVPVERPSEALAAPLAGARIAALIAATEVETVSRTGSTNTDLLGRVRAHAPSRPILRATLEQTAGRGRLGRSWHATPGSALLFSLAIPFVGARPIDGAVSLACGLAVAEALATRVMVQLKWPNDLLFDGRKLGGVLCELALDEVGQRTLVVGIGINLWLAPALRTAIGQPAAALDEVIPLRELATQREELIGGIALNTLAMAREFDMYGFAPLRTRFLGRFGLLGREVELFEPKRKLASGVAVDIDAAGRLLLQTEAGTRAFAGGELSLRPVTRDA
jgi:BirA family biotin operon repressor/biotin-[acetyl-CoA-carboxylase] ligase